MADPGVSVAPAGGDSIKINTKKTRALFRVVILLMIAAAGVASRLFSVIRMGAISSLVLLLIIRVAD
jgi:hypothetical protein